jgi:hypothetical protein
MLCERHSAGAECKEQVFPFLEIQKHLAAVW